MAVEDTGEVIIDGGEPVADSQVVDQTVDKGKEPPQPVENVMLEGIKQALVPKDPEAGKKVVEDAAAATAKKNADDEFAAANKGKTPEEIAAAQALRDTEAKKKAEADEAAKLKDKKADDFQLTPQMKKHLSQEAQQRFHQLHRHAKAQEETVAKLTETNKSLAEGRDGILGVLEETKTTQDQLIYYLNFNALVQSGDPKNLQTALSMVENQRAALYRALGKEAPGVDLLAEFPDLQQRVTESQITREDALELANSRRSSQAQAQQSTAQSEQQRADQAVKKAHDDALIGIEAWSKKMAAEDIDYKKKEEKLLAKLNVIMEKYPPNLWLPTFQSVYEAIEVVKPAALPSGGNGTLRPSGARPGAKTYTALTPEALRAGLGYPAAS